MQIGGATALLAPAASLLPAGSLASSVSPDVSRDITRAAQAPLTPIQSSAEQQSASAREEADQARGQPATQDDPALEGGASPLQQRLEQLAVARLSQRDQQVRAHEQAHASVGGSYAGAPTYSFKSGPDGKRYAVGGEVSIDVGPVPNDPEATLRKMEVVMRAALAPADPSAQDLRIAARAQAQLAQAQVDLAELRRSEAQATSEERAARAEQAQADEKKDKPAAASQQELPPPPSLELYQRLAGLHDSSGLIDLVA